MGCRVNAARSCCRVKWSWRHQRRSRSLQNPPDSWELRRRTKVDQEKKSGGCRNEGVRLKKLYDQHEIHNQI